MEVPSNTVCSHIYFYSYKAFLEHTTGIDSETFQCIYTSKNVRQSISNMQSSNTGNDHVIQRFIEFKRNNCLISM